MTMQRAAEIVKNAKGQDRYDLFDHFCTWWEIIEKQEIEKFALMCGMVVCENILN